nr:MAG TPA: hypothetical protein [Caudoviricetes sp.]
MRWIEEKKIQRQKIHRSRVYKKIVGAAETTGRIDGFGMGRKI